MTAILARRLGELLIAHGLAPAYCRHAEIMITARDEPLVIRYEVFVQPADLPKIAEALMQLAAQLDSSE